MHEAIDAVPSGEAATKSGAMLGQAPFKVVRNAHIERPGSAGEYIDRESLVRHRSSKEISLKDVIPAH
jgi:hypothetical protein